jgi:predicted Zn finger-like uncharacterized protein
MEFVCPACNATYQVTKRKIAAQDGDVTTCEKCHTTFVIEPKGSRNLNGETPEVKIASDPRPVGSPHSTVFLDYPQLKVLDFDTFRIEEILSPNKKGNYKSRKNLLKVKILMSVHAVLPNVLREGEHVLRVGKGIAYYPSELFLGNGWLTMLYNHYAIVCTSQRIVLINVNHRVNRPTHYFFQVPYEDIKSVKRGWFGTGLTITRIKGKRRIFSGIKAYQSKNLKMFLESMKKTPVDAENPKECLEYLCPSCFVPLAKGLHKCPQCSTLFKSSRRASFRSLLLPGLGDIYLGHRFLGVMELMGSVIVWGIILSLLLTGKQNGLFSALFLLIIYNSVDGVLTYHMAKKGYALE